MKTCLERIYNGLIKENPALVLMLGMCPTLAVTTSAINVFGMGLGFTAALLVVGLIREFLGAGTVEGNLARVDYSKCTGCGACAEKCPVKVISLRQ